MIFWIFIKNGKVNINLRSKTEEAMYSTIRDKKKAIYFIELEMD